MKPIKKVDYSELDLKAIELYAELLQNFTDIAKKVEKFRSKHIANYPLLFTIQQDSEYFVSEMKKGSKLVDKMYKHIEISNEKNKWEEKRKKKEEEKKFSGLRKTTSTEQRDTWSIN